MNTPTITLERDAALNKLDEYERAMKRNPQLARELDRDVMQGYRVLARGGRLVDVNAALAHAGVNLVGLPKLAIARAHVAQTTWYNYQQGRGFDGQYYWSGDYSMNTSGPFTGDRSCWRVARGTYPPSAYQSFNHYKALTPLIPLPHRPRHKLDNYFLLWEANWQPAPPVDPYLLRPITGSLMEIVAEWDVSPIELAAVRIAMSRAR